MRSRHIGALSASILCFVLLLTCNQAPQPAPTGEAAAPTASVSLGSPAPDWSLVVIGDSSLWRLGKAYASQIENDLGVQVILADYALPALSAGKVLADLRKDAPPYRRLSPQAIEALRRADVVVMFVNPRDSVVPENPLDLEGCFDNREPLSCDSAAFEQYTADLEAIWAEILKLRGGEPVILRATDIYNPLVSPWREAGVFEACTACWQNMSDAARRAAEAYNIPFLSRFDAFNGPNHDEDPRQKGYIEADGEHPTALAAEFTAGLLAEMGYEPLSRSAGVAATRGTSAPAHEDTGPAAAAQDTLARAGPYPLAEPGP